MATYTVTSSATIVLTATAQYPGLATATIVLSASCSETSGFLILPQATIVLAAQSWGRNILDGEPTLLRAVIRDDLTPGYPLNIVPVFDGLVLMANGIDPMLRWDGQKLQAQVAGVPAPDEPIGQVWLTGAFSNILMTTTTSWSGGQNGTETINTVISGENFDYFAYVRYYDEYGNFSDLSPISNPAITFIPGYSPSLPDGFGINSAFLYYTVDETAPATGVFYAGGQDITVYPPGDTVTVTNVQTFTVPEIIARFLLFDVVLTPLGMQGASSVSQTTYVDVPLPDGPFAIKVVGRQILRNTAGQASTFYVDIDTQDLESTLFVSNNSDTDILGNTPVPLFDELGNSLANLNSFPPSWKSALAPFLGRVFAAVDGVYTDGHVLVTAGSNHVYGTGTRWPVTMAGRTLYVVGANSTYLIDSVDTVNQVLTLDSLYTDSSSLFAFYAIRPAPGEWRLVYYTQAGLPEGWPPIYALELQEDGDELTGLMALSSFLYILENRHIYRFTFKDDPATDGAVFLSSQRGCINQRCWVQAEDTAYMLDEQGIHAFTGGISQAISEPIQDIFRDDSPSPLRVNWDAPTTFWHACYSEVHATVRWFVAMTGSKYPRHAICFNYRQNRWWIEEYHRPVCSSTHANVGIARVFFGMDHREMGCLNVGWTDGLRTPGATVRGTVGSSSATSLTDLGANFSPDSVNLAVFMTAGTSKGQWRRVVARSATRLDVLTPWLCIPRPGDEYVVGGIDYQWRAGWFRFSNDLEADNARDVEISFVPVSVGTADLQLYYNHIEEPRPWTRDADGSILITAGDPVGIVDLTQRQGRAILRLEGHLELNVSGDRYVSPEISGVQVEEPIRVFRITVNGAEAVG
jgi:hypothetical protein